MEETADMTWKLDLFLCFSIFINGHKSNTSLRGYIGPVPIGSTVYLRLEIRFRV